MRHLLTEGGTPGAVPLLRAKDLPRGERPRLRVGLRPFPGMGGLIPRGDYVLVKRVSAKEQARRLEAHLLTASDIPTPQFALENHLLYLHAKGQGLDPHLARGLTAFLNSTFADLAIRAISGSTQVNASDLLQLRYPPRDKVLALGRALEGEALFDTPRIDRLLGALWGERGFEGLFW